MNVGGRRYAEDMTSIAVETVTGIDAGLSMSDIIDTLAAARRSQSAIEALQIATLAVVVDAVLAAESSANHELALRSVAAELGAANRVAPRAMMRRLNDAYVLQHRFPATLDALSRGAVTKQHVDAIVAAGLPLDDDDARAAYEAVALERAKHETPGRLKEVLAVLAEEFQPTTMTERHRAARDERRVVLSDRENGMSELYAYLPSVLAHGIYDLLTDATHKVTKHRARAVGVLSRENAQRELAGALPRGGGQMIGSREPDNRRDLDRRGEPDDGEPDGVSTSADDHALDVFATDNRSFDQIRADVLSDIVLGGSPIAHGIGESGLTAHVQLTMPLLSAAGLSEDAAVLAGCGPIDAETARRLVGAASGWERVMTHPISGQILAVDRYRPSEDQRRALRVRDEHCRYPGCRSKIWRTDLDHSHDYAHGGETSTGNLANLCRTHHTMKHATGWRIRQLPRGVIEWISPNGKTYTDVPVSTLRFIATEDLPPGAPEPRCQRDRTAWFAAHDKRPVGAHDSDGVEADYLAGTAPAESLAHKSADAANPFICPEPPPF